jgi:hypothetical protein
VGALVGVGLPAKYLGIEEYKNRVITTEQRTEWDASYEACVVREFRENYKIDAKLFSELIYSGDTPWQQIWKKPRHG